MTRRSQMLVKFGYFVSTTGVTGIGVAHVFDVVLHALHVGDVAPAAQDELRVCVMEPVCPAGHARVWVSCGRGVHVDVTATVHDCVAAGFDEAQSESAAVVFVELVHCTVRDCVEFWQALQPPVCHE